MQPLGDLVLAARGGDQQAFARLVDAEGPGAFRLALAILGSEPDAQEAAQDAFMDAWRDLPRLRDPSRWSAWFRRLTVRAALDRARRHRRIAEIPLDGEVEPAAADASTAVVQRDELLRAFRLLPADDRALLALRFFADLEVPDVAAALGIPLGTAKSRLHRALGRLRTVLEAEA